MKLVTFNSTIGFKCFEQSRVFHIVFDKKTTGSIKEYVETRVVEIADDSNKTNFLCELAIETENLQTDAPCLHPAVG